MTHDDLAILIREDVRASEPQNGLDAMIPVGLGRRRLRKRRLASAVAGGVAATVMVTVGIATLTHPSTSPEPSPSREPAGLTKIRNLADEHVSAVLERSVANLGQATISGRDDHQALPDDRLDRATEVFIGYGSLEHSYAVNVVRSRQPVADTDDGCSPESAQEDISCSSTMLADGRFLVTQLFAVQPIGESSDAFPVGDEFAVVARDRLSAVNPEDRFFVRLVTMESPYATVRLLEQVRATDRTSAEAAMVVPLGDIESIVTDEAVLRIAADPGES
jgi:hypothetical protein